MWSSARSLACGEFTIEQALCDPFIRYAVNTSKPEKSALLEKDLEVLDSSLGDLGVCHSTRPLNAEDGHQISQMECIQPLFLSRVKNPRLAAIEEGAKDTDSVYGHLQLVWMVS